MSIAYHRGPSLPTPEQRLLLMNEDDWENFILQSVYQLAKEGVYTQVHRIGGAGDKGRDVCGNTQEKTEFCSWDLYQAKHYEDTLSPSTFAPDLAKFLFYVFSKQYTQPKNYFICALRIGPKLYDLVTNPISLNGETLKTWILKEWENKKGDFKTFKKDMTPELELFIEKFPFDIIKIKTPSELIDIHSRTDKHWEVFGILGPRGDNPEVPNEPEIQEQNYIKKLCKAYGSAQQKEVLSISEIPKIYNKHFSQQRILFYSAEGLNRFSRDKIPGAFEDLLDQVNTGIGSVESLPYTHGVEKITEVQKVANALQVTSNPLHARLQAGDLQGTCHHLANNRTLCWVEEDEDE
ncbi:ABC-three component system protein [Leclercia sp. Marseille-Q4284]|uniref:ABC-three component system protein n=1 Tax=Leclercia sp. Marseille-Q4284 TaxID=2866582 RepID=UPI001CE3ED5F|nr:ABC-three component system protein [Leclercia sp. Marseille-Q4284]